MPPYLQEQARLRCHAKYAHTAFDDQPERERVEQYDCVKLANTPYGGVYSKPGLLQYRPPCAEKVKVLGTA